jgi:cytochrome c biogenesis protein CcmG/thiol:disulfide interchange protein DsbE
MSGGGARRRAALAAAPLIVFVALAALFFLRLDAGDASRIPSALIGQSAPTLDLPGLDGAPGVSDADLRGGRVSIVNVFASWCAPCRAEHPFLMALADDADLKAKGVALIGVAQKDAPENVKRFLGVLGDPYAKIGLDRDGRAGIDWGVYGVPETFVVKGDGAIAYKLVGPIETDSAEQALKAEILKATN